MKQTKKNEKAFGLVEVLIGLAIFGTAIIAATSLTVKSLRIVKDNELADTANGIMIKTLELAKYPETDTKFPGLSDDGSKKIYYLTGNIDDFNQLNFDNLTFIKKTSELNTDGIPSTDCISQTGNQIKVNFEGISGLIVCNQIVFERLDSGNYEVSSRVIFQTAKEVREAEIKGFKNVSQ
jgi:hypothetical protein